jgi:hypothetical protein
MRKSRSTGSQNFVLATDDVLFGRFARVESGGDHDRGPLGRIGTVYRW